MSAPRAIDTDRLGFMQGIDLGMDWNLPACHTGILRSHVVSNVEDYRSRILWLCRAAGCRCMRSRDNPSGTPVIVDGLMGQLEVALGGEHAQGVSPASGMALHVDAERVTRD